MRLSTKPTDKGAAIQYQGGGGVAGVFVENKFFISTRLGGALKISNSITCLYRTVLKVKYLFRAESALNYLFQKTSRPSPHSPCRLYDAPLTPLSTVTDVRTTTLSRLLVSICNVVNTLGYRCTRVCIYQKC